jgi:hypothetical protein
MRSSLIVLAIVLATLRVVHAALRRRAGTIAPVRLARRHRLDADGERPARRFTEWRYYGFSNHAPEASDPAESPEVVAPSPTVGSVVTILPDDSVTTVVNGRVYRRCGSVWYQRQSIGSNVTYVVVPAP